MLYLIQYDRTRGVVVQMTEFTDAERDAADNARLALELAIRDPDLQQEVVLLEAFNEAALRVTHNRFFEERPGMSRLMATPSGSAPVGDH